MKSLRVPALCAGVLLLFASSLSSSGCSDDDTTTDPTGGGGTTGVAGQGGIGNRGGGGNIGGGGFGAQGGGGMMPIMGTDTCPGTPIAINHGFSASIMDTNANGTDSEQSACETFNGGEDGPETVYQLNVEQAGTLSVDVEPGVADATMYIRRVCGDRNSALFCKDDGGPQEPESAIAALNAGTYSLIIDTRGTEGGPYVLNMVFSAPDCGDGATNPGEECDDGNLDNNDGCDDQCNIEPGSNDSCADPFAVDVPASMDITVTGNTIGNTAQHTYDNTNSACGATESSPGKDRVHALTAAADGTMRLRLGWDDTNTDPEICAQAGPPPGCWGRVLHVREGDCSDIGAQIACGGPLHPTLPPPNTRAVQDFTFPVTANETYYVFVDSFWDGDGNPAASGGPFWLHVSLEPGGGGAGGAGGGGGAGGSGGN